MADMFIRSETVSGMADTIRKITNTEGKVNLGKFAKGEYEETFYEGKYTVSGTPEEDIPDGGGDSPLPIPISTEAEMTALLETAEVGSVYKYTGTTGTYENGAFYVVEAVV